MEIPAELAEAPSDSMFRQAVMRRYFSHLEATSESWEVNPRTGKGKVHAWIYRVALDGKLMSVEHQIAPVEPGEDGQASPIEEKARSYRLSPSDPSVLRRWKRMVLMPAPSTTWRQTLRIRVTSSRTSCNSNSIAPCVVKRVMLAL